MNAGPKRRGGRPKVADGRKSRIMAIRATPRAFTNLEREAIRRSLPMSVLIGELLDERYGEAGNGNA